MFSQSVNNIDFKDSSASKNTFQLCCMQMKDYQAALIQTIYFNSSFQYKINNTNGWVYYDSGLMKKVIKSNLACVLKGCLFYHFTHCADHNSKAPLTVKSFGWLPFAYHSFTPKDNLFSYRNVSVKLIHSMHILHGPLCAHITH